MWEDTRDMLWCRKSSHWQQDLSRVACREQEVTKLVYEVSEDDVTRAKNQFKAMQLFSTDSTAGAESTPCAADMSVIVAAPARGGLYYMVESFAINLVVLPQSKQGSH